MAGGLRELPSVDLKELPRMADFAEWGEAVGRGLGWGANKFLATYNENRKEATDLILDISPVAPLLLLIAKKQVDWSGTPLELYHFPANTFVAGFIGSPKMNLVTGPPAGQRHDARCHPAPGLGLRLSR